MIYTSSYYNVRTRAFKTYSISGDRGQMANYKGLCYPKLAPKKGFWKVWHDNIGKISEEENTKYYVREYYLEVLSKLDPEEVYKELNNSILLCYEQPDEFCHRDIVAAWLELFLVGVRVPEVKADKLSLAEVGRNKYYPIIKEYLEEVIKNTKDMKGYNDLRSLYLIEKNNKEKILVK